MHYIAAVRRLSQLLATGYANGGKPSDEDADLQLWCWDALEMGNWPTEEQHAAFLAALERRLTK